MSKSETYVESMPLATTVDRLRRGDLKLQEHIDSVCDRIKTVEPAIHALIPETERQQRLHAEAERLLQQYADVAQRPPLFGLLVGIKDIIHVDGFKTRCGSLLPPQLFCAAEATIVQKLRQAGVLVLGKTVTTEFALLDPGPTRNPHNTQHTPGGSSSGSAAAIAAGLCPLALGSQTVGSTIRPASYCGVVGFKPSYGRVSMHGVVPLAPALDHPGFFTQDPEGMERICAVVIKDWQLPAKRGQVVFGVPHGPYMQQAAAKTLHLFEQHVAKLVQQGWPVKQIETLTNIETINQQNNILFTGESAATHRDWLQKHASLYRPGTIAIIEEGMRYSEQDIEKAKALQQKVRRDIEQQMQQAGIDIWLSPAAVGPAPYGIESVGRGTMNIPWTFSGLPSLTVPMGEINGLPVGVQYVAAYMRDEILFYAAVK